MSYGQYGNTIDVYKLPKILLHTEYFSLMKELLELVHWEQWSDIVLDSNWEQRELWDSEFCYLFNILMCKAVVGKIILQVCFDGMISYS